MPELPEVETVRRGLISVMEREVVKEITVNRRDLRVAIPDDFEDHISGQKIAKLLRRGKYIALLTGNDKAVIWHLGMSGSVRIYKSHEKYAAEKHDHVIFTMEQGAKIAFNDPRRFGMMYLTTAAHWEAEKPFCAMGPEPLGNGFNGSALADKLKSKTIAIKNALLDQKVVAGVGNIYACEALYRTGIHPSRSSKEVTPDECDHLSRAIKDVLNEAIQSGGSSLRDHKMTDGSLAYFQHHFDVYDRAGDTCTKCQTACVERLVQSGRSSFFCSNTQR